MKKAVIIYQSRKGTTRKFAEEISVFLRQNNVEPTIASVQDFNQDALSAADYVFLGCWTNGMFLMFQHPDKPWRKFAEKLPDLNNKQVVLFTTYKVATGVMFKAMKKYIRTNKSIPELRSRNGGLQEQVKMQLLEIVNTQ
jgi:flavodoxin